MATVDVIMITYVARGCFIYGIYGGQPYSSTMFWMEKLAQFIDHCKCCECTNREWCLTATNYVQILNQNECINEFSQHGINAGVEFVANTQNYINAIDFENFNGLDWIYDTFNFTPMRVELNVEYITEIYNAYTINMIKNIAEVCRNYIGHNNIALRDHLTDHVWRGIGPSSCPGLPNEPHIFESAFAFD